MSLFAPPVHPRASLSGVLACLCALLVLPGTARAAADDEAGVRILNSLDTRHLLFNALTTNRAAVTALIQQPLTTRTFAVHASLKNQLEDPAAREVMKYLASCALPPGQEVKWVDHAGTSYSFPGEANLCPEWVKDKPSSTCLGLVTSCLLARNNAYDLVVSLSLRGEDPRDIWRFNPLRVSEAWSSEFLPCEDAKATGLDAACGWVGEGVGTCTPGMEVTVSAGAPYPKYCTGKLGDIGGDRVLRICEDPRGCTRVAELAEADRNDCGGLEPSISFMCPKTGTYSVMSAPRDRAAAPGTWVRPAASNRKYPTERFGAYTFREGAFYGNLFAPEALKVEVVLDEKFQPHLTKPGFKGVVYGKAYACHGRDWVEGDPHLNLRICANATIDARVASACAARTVGPCEPGSTSTQPARCAVRDGSLLKSDGDYESCQADDGTLYEQPLTVFLRSPCDLLETSKQTYKAIDCTPLQECSIITGPTPSSICLLPNAQPPIP
ncbi:hypothetical protein JGU66_27865 [Myxococcaceae bacterium JPH2]|nr:hypothetical protein [Myxococcaceae bacterium JPH2]